MFGKANPGRPTDPNDKPKGMRPEITVKSMFISKSDFVECNRDTPLNKITAWILSLVGDVNAAQLLPVDQWADLKPAWSWDSTAICRTTCFTADLLLSWTKGGIVLTLCVMTFKQVRLSTVSGMSAAYQAIGSGWKKVEEEQCKEKKISFYYLTAWFNLIRHLLIKTENYKQNFSSCISTSLISMWCDWNHHLPHEHCVSPRGSLLGRVNGDQMKWNAA